MAAIIEKGGPRKEWYNIVIMMMERNREIIDAEQILAEVQELNKECDPEGTKNLLPVLLFAYFSCVSQIVPEELVDVLQSISFMRYFNECGVEDQKRGHGYDSFYWFKQRFANVINGITRIDKGGDFNYHFSLLNDADYSLALIPDLQDHKKFRTLFSIKDINQKTSFYIVENNNFVTITHEQYCSDICNSLGTGAKVLGYLFTEDRRDDFNLDDYDELGVGSYDDGIPF